MIKPLTLRFYIQGHMRPAITFGARLIKETPNLTITFPVALSLQSDAIKQVEQHFTDEKDRVLRNRLRHVNLFTFLETTARFNGKLESSQ